MLFRWDTWIAAVCLRDLKDSLAEEGSDLMIRFGRVEKILQELVKEALICKTLVMNYYLYHSFWRPQVLFNCWGYFKDKSIFCIFEGGRKPCTETNGYGKRVIGVGLLAGEESEYCTMVNCILWYPGEGSLIISMLPLIHFLLFFLCNNSHLLHESYDDLKKHQTPLASPLPIPEFPPTKLDLDWDLFPLVFNATS